jgi:hypothetical protein
MLERRSIGPQLYKRGVHCLTLFSFSNDKTAETAKTP